MTLLNPDIWSGKLFTGSWSSSGETGTATDPATQAELGSWGMPSADDVRASAQSAARAQRDWAARPPSERAAVLRKAGMLFEEHAAEIEQWIVQESGAIAPKAQLETHIAAEECYEASALGRCPIGEMLSTDKPHWSIARRRAAGVVSVIAPFNFPDPVHPRRGACSGPGQRRAAEAGSAHRSLRRRGAGPHLRGGGAARRAAAPAARRSRNRSGHDHGPETRVVAFTGSTPAGRKIGALCAEHLKRAHLELGGNNAMVVLPARTSRRPSQLPHSDRSCTRADLYDHRPPHHPRGHLRRIRISPGREGRRNHGRQAFRLRSDDGADHRREPAQEGRLHRPGRARSGRPAAGYGTHDGLFYRPTVLGNVASDNPAWSDEIFGPVAPWPRCHPSRRLFVWPTIRSSGSRCRCWAPSARPSLWRTPSTPESCTSTSPRWPTKPRLHSEGPRTPATAPATGCGCEHRSLHRDAVAHGVREHPSVPVLSLWIPLNERPCDCDTNHELRFHI